SRRFTFILSLLLFFYLNIQAQQRPDTLFAPVVEKPTYALKTGPVVAIDGGHNNRHQLEGSFAPFAKLLRADGYQMQSIKEFSASNLTKIDVLVIVNALHESNIKNWTLPCPSAFTKEEIETVKNWVEVGGRLLVMADHMPYGGAANDLAQAFDFAYENGFAMGKKERWPPELYAKKAGNLLEHEITKGINQLAGFTGSALIAPESAAPIAYFPKKHELLLPEVAWQFKTKTIKKPLDHHVFGAVQDFGNGKVAFFTESAMFTAQIFKKNFEVGFNSPKAPENQQFILNLMHWLD
ncbi:MAG: DUF4350 domain-containing protein, partial [Bacteroidota bacterium]